MLFKNLLPVLMFSVCSYNFAYADLDIAACQQTIASYESRLASLKSASDAYSANWQSAKDSVIYPFIRTSALSFRQEATRLGALISDEAKSLVVVFRSQDAEIKASTLSDGAKSVLRQNLQINFKHNLVRLLSRDFGMEVSYDEHGYNGFVAIGPNESFTTAFASPLGLAIQINPSHADLGSRSPGDDLLAITFRETKNFTLDGIPNSRLAGGGAAAVILDFRFDPLTDQFFGVPWEDANHNISNQEIESKLLLAGAGYDGSRDRGQGVRSMFYTPDAGYVVRDYLEQKDNLERIIRELREACRN